MKNDAGISTLFNIEEIRVLAARAFLFGIKDFDVAEREALKETGILAEESSIGGAMGAIFTPAGLRLARAIAQQFCYEAERTYRSMQ